MATNSGACSSDTAGTATLIVLSGVSAENDEAKGDSNKTVREIRIVHRVMGSSFSRVGTTRLPQAGENVQLGFKRQNRNRFGSKSPLASNNDSPMRCAVQRFLSRVNIA